MAEPLHVAPLHVAPLRVASRVACGDCHADIVREWESSPHRRAYSNVWFQSGYRVDHRAFCRDCHAPLNEGVDPAVGTLAYEEGIGCAECHVHDREHPSSAPRADFSARACADCHQFRFPSERGPARFDPREWMQRTEDERRASGTTESCAACHMAGDGERATHAFSIVDEPGRVADAISIDVTATARGALIDVEVRLSGRGAGHAVPTGDVFRALELTVWTDSAPPQRRLLMRRFGTKRAFDPARGISATLGELEDTRIPPHGARVERFAVAGRADTVRYRLDYLRVNPAQAAAQHLADAGNRTTLQQGALPVARLRGDATAR